MTDKKKSGAPEGVQAGKTKATLYCVNPPSDEQKEGIAGFLEKTYGVRPEIEVIEDK